MVSGVVWGRAGFGLGMARLRHLCAQPTPRSDPDNVGEGPRKPLLEPGLPPSLPGELLSAEDSPVLLQRVRHLLRDADVPSTCLQDLLEEPPERGEPPLG